MSTRLPSYERRQQTYADADPDRAQAVAGADAMVYCSVCETSHPAIRTADGYATDCPNQ